MLQIRVGVAVGVVITCLSVVMRRRVVVTCRMVRFGIVSALVAVSDHGCVVVRKSLSVVHGRHQ